MSAQTVSELFDPLIESAVHSAWQQWGEIGAAAGLAENLNCIVDPEALVLASTVLASREYRIVEVMNGWLVGHADVLSVQRLVNLAGKGTSLPRYDLGKVAACASKGHNGHRWAKLASAASQASPRSLKMKGPVPLVVTSPAALMLRLRLGVGVGVKADALAFLLGRGEWQSVQEVTRATGYTVAAVRRALDELSQARFVESEEPVEWRARRSRHFRAIRETWLPANLGKTPPVWGYFRERYDFVVHLQQWMGEDSHGNRAQRWDEIQLGDWGKRWMELHPLAFRFEAEDLAAYRGKLEGWAAHFQGSLQRLTHWFREEV